jgi:hypothetical protein
VDLVDLEFALFRGKLSSERITMLSFFKKLKSIFSPSRMSAVRGIVGSVYPIVEFIAQMTPTKADDEIIRCANALGVQEFLYAPDEGAGHALKELAIKAAQKKFKNIPVEVLARAVEAAYQEMKAKQAL